MPSSNPASPPFPHLITIRHPCTNTLTYLLHADNTCIPAPSSSSNVTLLTAGYSSPDSNHTPLPSSPTLHVPSRHPLCPSCYSACEQAIVDRYAAALGDAVVTAHREGWSEDEIERVCARVWEEYERMLGELEREAGGFSGEDGEVLLPRVVEGRVDGDGEGGDEVNDEEEGEEEEEEAEMEAFRARWREIGGAEEGEQGSESDEGRNDESGDDEVDSDWDDDGEFDYSESEDDVIDIDWDDDGEFGYSESDDDESYGNESDSEEQVVIV